MRIIIVQRFKTFKSFWPGGQFSQKIQQLPRLPTQCWINTLMLQVKSDVMFLSISNIPHFTLPPKNLDGGQNLKKSNHCIVAPNALYKYAKWWSCKIETLGGDSFWKKRSKINPGGQSATLGAQKILHTLGPIIRLKLPQDEDAAFAYLFCTGIQNKNANFWPRGQNLKNLPALPVRTLEVFRKKFWVSHSQ